MPAYTSSTVSAAPSVKPADVILRADFTAHRVEHQARHAAHIRFKCRLCQRDHDPLPT